MKKIVTLLLAMFFTINLFSQNVDSIPLPDTTKLTLNKVYTDVKAGINGLAQSLKVSATHVYGIMVKQQIVKAVSNLVVIIVFAIIAILLLNMGSRYRTRHEKSQAEADENLMIVGYIGFVMSAFIFIGFFLFRYDDIIGGFINPEYGAIKEIIRFVKSSD